MGGQLGATKVRSRHRIDEVMVAAADSVVATIRNPFDVLVSWYHYHSAGADSNRTIEEYLDWVWGSPQDNPHRNSHLEKSALRHAEHADLLVRHELGLANEFNRVLKQLGLSEVDLPHVGAAERRKPYRDYFDDNLRNRVLAYYAEDFERFHYGF